MVLCDTAKTRKESLTSHSQWVSKPSKATRCKGIVRLLHEHSGSDRDKSEESGGKLYEVPFFSTYL